MVFFREFRRKLFAPFLRGRSQETIYALSAATKIVYGMGASFLAYQAWKLQNRTITVMSEEKLLLGEPIIVDKNDKYRRLRESGKENAVIYEYVPGEGMKETYYNRNEYLQQLEDEAYARAKAAQEKALKEGRSLPAGAIKLV